MDGADDVVDHALVAQRAARRWPTGSPARGRCRGPRQQRAQPFGVGLEHRLDAVVERARRAARGGRAGPAPRSPRNSPSPGRASAISSTLVPAPAERLGDLERVHDAAARLDRVGEHRDPHAATASAASRAAAALVGATMTPACAQRRLLAGGVLRVAVGAAHVRDHRDGRGERPSAGASPPAGSACEPWPITTSSRTQPTPSVAGRCEHAEADLEVDHRVRAALRVLLLAEVEDRVAAVAAVAGVAADRAEHGLEDRHRLVGERAAGVQAEQLPPARGASTSGLERRDVRRAPRRRPRTRPRRASGGSRTARPPPSQPTKAATTRLPSTSTPPSRWTTSRAGGLETSSSVSVPSSAASIRIASPNMIPPTSVERSRPPTPTICDTPTLGAVEQARGLLRAGARGGDDADRARSARRWRTRARPRRASPCRSPGP